MSTPLKLPPLYAPPRSRWKYRAPRASLLRVAVGEGISVPGPVPAGTSISASRCGAPAIYRVVRASNNSAIARNASRCPDSAASGRGRRARGRRGRGSQRRTTSRDPRISPAPTSRSSPRSPRGPKARRDSVARARARVRCPEPHAEFALDRRPADSLHSAARAPAPIRAQIRRHGRPCGPSSGLRAMARVRPQSADLPQEIRRFSRTQKKATIMQINQ